MRTRRRRWTRGLALGLIALTPSAFGQGEGQAPAWPTLAQAVQALKPQAGAGAPPALVVVATSSAGPESATLVGSIRQAAAALPAGRVLFAEMPEETYADRLKALGVRRFPSVLIYRSGPKGLVAVGLRDGLTEGAQVVTWLRTLGLAGSGSFRQSADGSVLRTGGHTPSGQGPIPSGQYESMPPTPKTPPVSYPTPQPQPFAPVYTQPAPQPVVVSAPSPPVVFQPSAPTIVVGPTPQPNIVFANAPTSAPNVTVINAGNAPTGNAPQQLFMAPAPPTANAPVAPQPTANAPVAPQPLAYAPQPLAYAPAAPQPLAYAPQANAPTANSPALAVALLSNPRLLGRLIGALGEHLAEKKNPRIQMGNAPTLAQAPTAGNAPTAGAPLAYAPSAYAPAAGYAPVAFAPPMSAAPAPPMFMAVGPPIATAPVAEAYPPQPRWYPTAPPAPYPTGPSPQGDASGPVPRVYAPQPTKQGFFQRHFGH